jgi:hypothetical protein
VTIEDHFPAVLSDAERSAAAGQSSFMRLSATGLILACVAAVGGAVSVDVTVAGRPVDLGGVLALAAFAAGVGVASYLLSTSPQRQWYEGRAAAESVKTLAWQYTVGGGVFGIDTDTDPDSLFVERLGDVMSAMRAVRVVQKLGHSQITPQMRQWRQEPLPQRRAAYLQHRVDNQIAWYGDKATYNHVRVRRWFLVAIAAQTFGLAVAGIKAFAGVDVDLLGIVAAVAASATAWLQTRDHQNLAESYAVTARELALVRTRADGGGGAASEQEWAAFVEETERAVSREHTLWLARRGTG